MSTTTRSVCDATTEKSNSRCDSPDFVSPRWLSNLRFENFAVRANYIPQSSGFQCDLVRDDAIYLLGNRRRQFALRAIFTKVFSKNRPIPVINPELSNDQRLADLFVNQFVAHDGWVGISFTKRDEAPMTPEVATQPRHSGRGRRGARR